MAGISFPPQGACCVRHCARQGTPEWAWGEQEGEAEES